LLVAVAIAAALRFSFFPFESGDYQAFLSSWYDHFLHEGRWAGLGKLDNEKFASYPPLYMTAMSLLTFLPIPKLYAIKALSCIFDFIGALLFYRLAKLGGKDSGNAFASICLLLFLPTVVMNGSVWAQCDMMYTTCFLWSFYSYFKGRFTQSMIAFGFAISLKPQAIFWIPFLYPLLFTGRIPIRHLIWPPIIFVVSGLPECIAGRPFFHMLFHWLRVTPLPGLSLGAPNWYQWMPAVGGDFAWWAGVALGGLAAAVLILFAVKHHGILGSPKSSISFLLLCLLLLPFLLPGMHERYFFAADVFSLLYAVWIPGGWIPAIYVQAGSLFSYWPYLFGTDPVPGSIRAFFILAAIVLVGRETWLRRMPTSLKARSEDVI
jgi:Gpi18-like mannosyltransferase